MSDADKRRRLRAHYEACSRISAAWAARGYGHPPPANPPFPDDLRDLMCGAKTRAGTPCKMTALYINGRCKLHGGLSTGPRTTDGKARAALNGRAPKQKRTP